MIVRALTLLTSAFLLSSCQPKKDATPSQQSQGALATAITSPAGPTFSLTQLSGNLLLNFIKGESDTQLDFHPSDPFEVTPEERHTESLVADFIKKHRITDPLASTIPELSSDSETAVLDLKPSLTSLGFTFQKDDQAILYYNSYYQAFLLLKSTPENIKNLDSLLRTSGYIVRPTTYLSSFITQNAATGKTLSSLSISSRTGQTNSITQLENQLEIELSACAHDNVVVTRIDFKKTPNNPAHQQSIRTAVTYPLDTLFLVASQLNPQTQELENFYLKTEVEEVLHPYETAEFRLKIEAALATPTSLK